MDLAHRTVLEEHCCTQDSMQIQSFMQAACWVKKALIMLACMAEECDGLLMRGSRVAKQAALRPYAFQGSPKWRKGTLVTGSGLTVQGGRHRAHLALMRSRDPRLMAFQTSGSSADCSKKSAMSSAAASPW